MQLLLAETTAELTWPRPSAELTLVSCCLYAWVQRLCMVCDEALIYIPWLSLVLPSLMTFMLGSLALWGLHMWTFIRLRPFLVTPSVLLSVVPLPDELTKLERTKAA